MKQSANSKQSGFTLMELLVVIVIIAVLAGLIFPVVTKIRLRGVETRAGSNLRQIAAAIGSYASDHGGSLPGPLTVEQYPTFGTDPARDSGSLAKQLATYLGLQAKTTTDTDQAIPADVLACPLAAPIAGERLDEIAGYIMNMELVHDYEQPAWGVVGDDTKPPLTQAALTAWRDTSTAAVTANGTAVLARKWAMRHTDKVDCGMLKLSGTWVDKLPDKPLIEGNKVGNVQYGRYQTLFFDMHVEPYEPVDSDGNLKP